jgi:hypothetical protein
MFVGEQEKWRCAVAAVQLEMACAVLETALAQNDAWEYSSIRNVGILLHKRNLFQEMGFRHRGSQVNTWFCVSSPSAADNY